jgi:hypothetical protein
MHHFAHPRTKTSSSGLLEPKLKELEIFGSTEAEVRRASEPLRPGLPLRQEAVPMDLQTPRLQCAALQPCAAAIDV